MSEQYFAGHPKSKRRPAEIQAAVRGQSFTFRTDAGVFSRNEIDRGTELLLAALEVGPCELILDLGCGLLPEKGGDQGGMPPGGAEPVGQPLGTRRGVRRAEQFGAQLAQEQAVSASHAFEANVSQQSKVGIRISMPRKPTILPPVTPEVIHPAAKRGRMRVPAKPLRKCGISRQWRNYLYHPSSIRAESPR